MESILLKKTITNRTITNTGRTPSSEINAYFAHLLFQQSNSVQNLEFRQNPNRASNLYQISIKPSKKHKRSFWHRHRCESW